MEDISLYISINPDIRSGKPIINGTRITVSDILGWLASGMTPQEIIYEYPLLKDIHIRAALYFAAHRETVIKTITAA